MLEGHTDFVRSLVAVPGPPGGGGDGGGGGACGCVASASDDKTLRIWCAPGNRGRHRGVEDWGVRLAGCDWGVRLGVRLAGL